jgi:geranylgeranyl pyrophosphate synthase
LCASILEWNSLIKHSNEITNESTSKYKQIFEQFLDQEFKKKRGSNAITEKVLTPSIREAVIRGGKRIRPALALLSCEAISGSGSYARALPVALAFELAHCASLVQDDIFDNAALRRNQPTIYQSFGAVKAVLSSDYIIFEIFRSVSAYENLNFSTKKVIKMINYICDAAEATIEGELLDVALSLNTQLPPSQKEYLEMIGLKTAKLFAASTALGALAGGATARQTDKMYEYGYNLGLAFQIMDDVLDIIGNIATTGKMPLKDLENNSSNIVIINALTTSDPMKRNLVRSMLWKKSVPADADSLIKILNDLGSIEVSISLASKFNEKARKSLRGLPDSPAKEILEKLSLSPVDKSHE